MSILIRMDSLQATCLMSVFALTLCPPKITISGA